eukprot:SAG11_NODE_15205_length_585_cov_1.569959_1_plen_174_part_00
MHHRSVCKIDVYIFRSAVQLTQSTYIYDGMHPTCPPHSLLVDLPFLYAHFVFSTHTMSFCLSVFLSLGLFVLLSLWFLCLCLCVRVCVCVSYTHSLYLYLVVCLLHAHSARPSHSLSVCVCRLSCTLSFSALHTRAHTLQLSRHARPTPPSPSSQSATRCCSAPISGGSSPTS